MKTSIEEILSRIGTLSEETFGENLTGVYVHGSLALSCFTWERSDIDFITVVKNPPAQAEKEAYIAGLMEIEKSAPPKGLEMSVVLEEVARNFVYPTPFELHFSKMHLDACARDLSAYCRDMHGTDVDLAAHFTIIRRACIPLCGEPPEAVFGDVPARDYLDSIQSDVASAAEDILNEPVSTILNLCRVAAFKTEGRVLSKEEGGRWGIRHLGDAAPLIQSALNAYRGAPFEADAPTLRRFAEEMEEEK